MPDSPRFFCLATQAWSSHLPSPQLALAEPNGLLAMGGSLMPQTLLDAYRVGIFPWFSVGQPILWWSPTPRAVLRPSEFHRSRSLKRTLAQQAWRITLDARFAEVVAACGGPRRGQDSTWLSCEMQAAYVELHRAGHAHSLECWLDETLVGGIYGVTIGQIFFGESMFSRISDGSKVALFALCQRLQRWGYRLLDCQIPNPHLVTLGMSLLTREQFQLALAAGCAANPTVHAWASEQDARP